jgi:hypothetical protein
VVFGIAWNTDGYSKRGPKEDLRRRNRKKGVYSLSNDLYVCMKNEAAHQGVTLGGYRKHPIQRDPPSVS